MDDAEVKRKAIFKFQETGHTITDPSKLVGGMWIYTQCETCGVTVFNWSRFDMPKCDRPKNESK